MAQKPIHPDGGEAPKVFARIDRRDLVRLDRVAEARCLRRSQVIRAAVEALFEREELLTA